MCCYCIAAMLPRLRGLKLLCYRVQVCDVLIAAMLPRLRGLKCIQDSGNGIAKWHCSDVAPIEGTEILV